MMRKLLAMMAVVMMACSAQAAEDNPYHLVTQKSAEVMKVLRDAEGYAEKEPRRLYEEVEAVMATVIDFKSFARGVMGPYGTGKYYRSLPDESARAAYRAEVERFVGVFREGLMQKYADVLYAYRDASLQTEPAPTRELSPRGEVVRQKISVAGSTPLEVQYFMRPDRKTGEWKLRDVVLLGVSVGQTYANQFASAAQANGGDLAAVIDGWVVR